MAKKQQNEITKIKKEFAELRSEKKQGNLIGMEFDLAVDDLQNRLSDIDEEMDVWTLAE